MGTGQRRHRRGLTRVLTAGGFLGVLACSGGGGDAASPTQPTQPSPTFPSPVTLSAEVNLSQIIPDLVDAGCAVPSDLADPLYLVPFEHASNGRCRDIVPIRAPGTGQVVLDDWNDAGGEVTIGCESGGTRYTFELRGLIPGGMYTVWHFPGSGAGALSGQGTTQPDNAFTAAADGSVTFTTLSRGGVMTMGGSLPQCQVPVPKADAAGEFGGELLVVLFHNDGQSHGRVPGPGETIVSHLFFMAPQ